MGKRINYTEFWEPLLTDCFLQDLRSIEEDLKGLEIVPRPELVLRFLQTNRVKGVIFGQDPYSTPEKATGRSFEVGDLNLWQDSPNDSVLEIAKALYRLSDPSRSDITKEALVNDENFIILPPNKLFVHWESEGILLLNMALTCAPRVPGSHLVLWAPIINKIVRFLRKQSPPPFWFLWGVEAQKLELLLPKRTTYPEVHPNIQGKKPGSYFSETATCFAKEEIDWYGKNAGATPITTHQKK